MDARQEAALRAVVAYIELHPERWSQRAPIRRWRGERITYDLAGWVCKLARLDLAELLVHGPDAVYFAARDLLGLTPEQAARLFRFGQGEAHPSVADLKARVTGVTGIRFDRPDLPLVEDGHGNLWYPCRPGCDLHVVRPGRAACSCGDEEQVA